ncbi:site-specific integrase [Mycolicibacterium sp. 050158]|uniref:site-specific integrase n=1 Tax=Mycolicibacterium sp. 050158 TaxID=3090602 RepID=UPI00299E910B|nr:site-specific integrase [Mycolicibacterium sp. 050158]MDX1890128.1 site-specific integrase [Mycolicibacterium sp. 050158]
MARGRPPLRIGERGKITRTNLGGGLWLARCRFRDADGVTRTVERRGSSGKNDDNGRAAEDLLIESLKDRRPPGVSGEVSLDTKISVLIDQHLALLEDAGKSPATLTTYRSAARKLLKFSESVRVGEATPGRMNSVIRSMKKAHGANMARHGRTLLRGALQIAVLDDVLGSNPIAQVSRIESDRRPKGAPALDVDQLRALIAKIRASEECQKADLVDPIIMLIATGLRRSELLALLWENYDEKRGTIVVAGKVVRVPGEGLRRLDSGKTVSSARTVPLPAFAVAVLQERRGRDFWGEQKMIFPSSVGTSRDPDNFNKQWRKVRGDLGVPDVTSHSFRKSVATMIDDAGMSARVGADQLGHSRVSMTMDTYMRRGKIHSEVADLLDRNISVE